MHDSQSQLSVDSSSPHRFRLGCKPTPPHKLNRQLRLDKYLQLKAVLRTPVSTNRRAKVKTIGMMLNDRLGDCTIAAAGHMLQLWTANVGVEFTPTDAQIQAAYSAVSGYNPATGANDNGANIVDVLDYWRKTGIAGNKLGAHAQIDVHRIDLIKAAISIFGAVDCGLFVPDAVLDGRNIWQGPATIPKTGPWSLNQNNGHSITIVDYDADWLYGYSWSMLIKISWQFILDFFFEIHAVIDAAWLSGGKTVDGLDMTALSADLTQLTGGNVPVDPTPPPPVPPVPPQPPVPPPTPAPIGGWTQPVGGGSVTYTPTKTPAYVACTFKVGDLSPPSLFELQPGLQIKQTPQQWLDAHPLVKAFIQKYGLQLAEALMPYLIDILKPKPA